MAHYSARSAQGVLYAIAGHGAHLRLVVEAFRRNLNAFGHMRNVVGRHGREGLLCGSRDGAERSPRRGGLGPCAPDGGAVGVSQL